ncbi:MAG TPA: hypothetical protein VJS11_08035, partial [Acidobacteriaceae bacterium]|nr:hypothetical protein [Acidobacteriaceae bacterium]
MFIALFASAERLPERWPALRFTRPIFAFAERLAERRALGALFVALFTSAEGFPEGWPPLPLFTAFLAFAEWLPEWRAAFALLEAAATALLPGFAFASLLATFLEWPAWRAVALLRRGWAKFAARRTVSFLPSIFPFEAWRSFFAALAVLSLRTPLRSLLRSPLRPFRRNRCTLRLRLRDGLYLRQRSLDEQQRVGRHRHRAQLTRRGHAVHDLANARARGQRRKRNLDFLGGGRHCRA